MNVFWVYIFNFVDDKILIFWIKNIWFNVFRYIYFNIIFYICFFFVIVIIGICLVDLVINVLWKYGKVGYVW